MSTIAKAVAAKLLGSVAALAVLAFLVILAMRSCERGRESDEDAAADSLEARSERGRDSAIARAVRAETELAFLRAAHAEDSLYIAQTRRSMANITEQYNLLSQTVTGIWRLMPRAGSRDTAELVGPRTKALLDSNVRVIARQDTTIRRDSVRIARLFRTADSLSGAFWQLDTAYKRLDSAAVIWKRQRYGWKDRVTIGPTYGAHTCPPDSERTVCRGWGLSVQYTAARPLRMIDEIPRLVRRIF